MVFTMALIVLMTLTVLMKALISAICQKFLLEDEKTHLALKKDSKSHIFQIILQFLSGFPNSGWIQIQDRIRNMKSDRTVK